MNNQEEDQTEQLGRNDNQNEVDPSSSLTTESDQRLPVMFSGPNFLYHQGESSGTGAQVGSEATLPFDGPRNIQNVMLDHLSNLYEHQMQISLGVANNPSAETASGTTRIELDFLGASGTMRMEVDFLRGSGTTQMEEWMMLDYVMGIFHILEEQMIDANNIPNEGVILDEEEDENANKGLSEEEIMTNIRQEKFESIGEDEETCYICLEDFVNGEEVGRLDCVHRFHVECIKRWLMKKNICPVCRKTALAIDNDNDV